MREVAHLVAVSDPDARAAVIGRHLARLEAQLGQTRSAIVSLRRLLQPAGAPLEVRRTHSAAATVAAVRAVVDLEDVLAWYDQAMGEIDAALRSVGAVPSGPPGGLYDDTLFTEERFHALVYVPVDDPPVQGTVVPFVIPAADLASTMHVGAHDDIDVTYAALGSYLSSHALQVAGPVREIYHVGPRDTDDSARWRTEIGRACAPS